VALSLTWWEIAHKCVCTETDTLVTWHLLSHPWQQTPTHFQLGQANLHELNLRQRKLNLQFHWVKLWELGGCEHNEDELHSCDVFVVGLHCWCGPIGYFWHLIKSALIHDVATTNWLLSSLLCELITLLPPWAQLLARFPESAADCQQKHLLESNTM